MAPVAVRWPVKPSNGAANESAQFTSVTDRLELTNDGSQCFVTLQAPPTSGQPLPLALPAVLPVGVGVEVSVALEEHAPRNRATSRILVMAR